MGAFKLALPWAGRTVIRQVVEAVRSGGIERMVVVLGHRAGEVEAALAGTGVTFAFNARYGSGEMLESLRTGLNEVAGDCRAVLLCLGDQPQILPSTVRDVLHAGESAGWERIVIPSHNMRSGHPILLPEAIWGDIRTASGTLRDILRDHRERVLYLPVDTPTVLADLDTPEDYAREQRRTESR